MSHINPEYVKSHKEIIVENKEKKIDKCIYELHDGNYICIETIHVPDKREDGSPYDWKGKMESCKSYLCSPEGDALKEKDDLMDFLKTIDV